MNPHAVASSSLLAAPPPDLEEGRSAVPDRTGAKGFHEAFAKARALDEARPAAESARARPRPEASDGGATRRADRPSEASTRRRDEARERHDADARRADDRADGRRTDAQRAEAGRADASAVPGGEVRTGDAAITDPSEAPPASAAEAPLTPDASALLAFLQPAVIAPLAPPRGPLGLAFQGSGSGAPSSQGDGSAAGGAASLTGARVATFEDTDHTSEAALHHLSDAFARAEHLAARGALGPDGAAADAAGGALSTEGMQLSADARARLEAQAAGHAAQAAQATHDAQAAQGAELTKSVDAATARRGEAGAVADAASLAAAADASGAGAGAREAGRDGSRFGEEAGGESASERARDAFARASDAIGATDAASDVRAHGAFGADPRLQAASKPEANAEARAEQAKAASERVLRQVERLAEQRNVGRDMIIATERGPVRVRVEMAEKQVSVAFRTEDEQLKAMLRSGLPALQSTLAKRGFAGSEFRFDGDGADDMMASGGRGKHAEARAMRESLLGEVMVEPVVADAADSARRDPKALLSVTA